MLSLWTITCCMHCISVDCCGVVLVHGPWSFEVKIPCMLSLYASLPILLLTLFSPGDTSYIFLKKILSWTAARFCWMHWKLIWAISQLALFPTSWAALQSISIHMQASQKGRLPENHPIGIWPISPALSMPLVGILPRCMSDNWAVQVCASAKSFRSFLSNALQLKKKERRGSQYLMCWTSASASHLLVYIYCICM